MLQAIKCSCTDKASGPDRFTNRVLQAYAKALMPLLTPTFQACIHHEYHPHAYKCAHTITLKKPQKKLYHTKSLAAYNFIKYYRQDTEIC